MQHLHEVVYWRSLGNIYMKFRKIVMHNCKSVFGEGQSMGITLFNLIKLAICWYHHKIFRI